MTSDSYLTDSIQSLNYLVLTLGTYNYYTSSKHKARCGSVSVS